MSRGPGIQVKLTDFGIGQVTSQEAVDRVTRPGFTETLVGPGAMIGTPMYMAPEVVGGRPSSVRWDLSSLGVILYQLLTGDLARPVTQEWHRDVRDHTLRRVIRRCLSSEHHNGFPSGAELATALRLSVRQARRERRS